MVLCESTFFRTILRNGCPVFGTHGNLRGDDRFVTNYWGETDNMPDSQKAIYRFYMAACLNWVAVGLYYLYSTEMTETGGFVVGVVAIVLARKLSASFINSIDCVKSLKRISINFYALSVVPAVLFLFTPMLFNGETEEALPLLFANLLIVFFSAKTLRDRIDFLLILARITSEVASAKETAGQNENDLESQTTEPATDE